MNPQERIGNNAYIIKNNKIEKDYIIGCQVTTKLNQGDVNQGELLHPDVKYETYSYGWFNESDVYWEKEDLIKEV